MTEASPAITAPPPLDDSLEGRRFHVSLDTTSHCNLKCRHCWMDAVRAQGFKFSNKVMPFDLFEKICGDFVGRCRSFGVSCGYEPLINQDFARYVRHAVEVGLPDVHFYTNGTLLKEEQAPELVESGVERIVFSLEGAEEDAFRDIRRGATLERFLQAIDWINDAKKAAGLDKPLLRLNWVVMARNLDQLPVLAELAAKHQCGEVYLLPHIRWEDTELDREPCVLDLDLVEVTAKFDEFERRCGELGVRVVNEMMLHHTPSLARTPALVDTGDGANASLIQRLKRLLGLGDARWRSGVGPEPPFCVQPWEIMLITAEGVVIPCTGMPYDHPYGSFADKTIQEIWDSPTYKQLRDGLLGRGKACGHCRRCPHFAVEPSAASYHQPRRLDAAALSAVIPGVSKKDSR